MKKQIECPSCSARGNIDTIKYPAGSTVKCPRCKKDFTVPGTQASDDIGEFGAEVKMPPPTPELFTLAPEEEGSSAEDDEGPRGKPIVKKQGTTSQGAATAATGAEPPPLPMDTPGGMPAGDPTEYKVWVSEEKTRRGGLRNIFLLLLIIICLGAGVGYWYFRTTPTYSLWQVAKSYKAHDLAKFEKYVDIERVAGSLIDESLKAVTTDGRDDEFERMTMDLGQGFVAMLKPQLVKLITPQVESLIEHGSFEDPTANKQPGGRELDSQLDFSLGELYVLVGGDDNEFKGVTYTKKDGKIAYVGLGIYSKLYEEELTLELKMRKREGYWQVVALSNFSDLLKRIDELDRMKVAELNIPLREEMNRTLVLRGVTKEALAKQQWSYERKILFEIEVENIGEKEIDDYGITITCTDKYGEILRDFSARYNTNIAPGESGGGVWSMSVNSFIPADQIIYDAEQQDLSFSMDVDYIEFSDGTELRLYKGGDLTGGTLF